MYKKSRLALWLKSTSVVLAAFIGGVSFLTVGPDVSRISASVGGPTPGHTGAPLEGNCTACHTSFPVNSGTGTVTIGGLPKTWVPNQQIPITVTVSQVDGVIYGYQLTAIDSLGRRAGTFTFPPSTPAQSQTDDGFIGGNFRHYASHTVEGTIPTMFGSKTWNIIWTAPNARRSTVGLYVAGNAANSDGNTPGDYIYTSSAFTTSGSPLTDLDGDGKTDLSIHRPSPPTGAEWWYNRSSDGVTRAFVFGNSADVIAPADFTGDGKTDVAFFRASTGSWFVLRSEDSSFFSFPFGANGDVPIPADFDADGKADPAVFRPSSATWFINKSTGGTDILVFGSPSDLPTVADYDGDAKADIAITRTNGGNREWWIRRSSTGVVFATVFGVPTDKTVQGDYTGDGKADIAFWRPSNGNWFVLRSEDLSFFAFPFGANGDIPVPGDYDGDGKNDAAVFRPSSATWFANKSAGGTLIQVFGSPSDVPLPSAYVR
jgi:hypothetical protein